MIAPLCAMVALIVAAAPPQTPTATTTTTTATVKTATANTATTKTKTKVFVYGVRADGADDTLARVVERRIVEEALMLHVDAVGREELRSLLDVQAVQQATGCDGDASCLAEIAGGIGAELVVTGTLARLSDGHYSLSLSLFDTKRAVVVNRASAEADRADGLKDAVRPAAKRLFAPIAGHEAPAWPAVFLVGGGVGVAAGGVAMAVGFLPLLDANVRSADATAAADRFHATGSDAALQALAAAHDQYEVARASWSTWGVATVIGGVAAVAAGGALLVVGATSLE